MENFNLLIFLFLALIGLSKAFPEFEAKIPNGDKVPHPCIPNANWPGVGHELVQGNGPLTGFGRDFEEAGEIWTSELCRKDSDGDGKTNGEELGDPDCVWTGTGSTPAVTDTAELSHPGVCEPIDSLRCKPKTTFLQTIEECGKILNAKPEDWCPALGDADVKSMDLTFQNASIPSADTTYFCQMMTVPDDQDYHIIAWEPIIDSVELLHHLIVMPCTPEEDDAMTKQNIQPYQQPETCAMAPRECPNFQFIWAFGMGKRCFGNDVGVPMGRNYYRRLILQIHYNNPSMLANIKDSSGMRLYYTTKKRRNEAAVLGVGQQDIAVPPKSVTTVSADAFLGSESCSRDALKPFNRFYVNSMLFHMHKIGTVAKLFIKKADGQLIPLANQTVRYDRPLMLIWDQRSEQPVLEPGDDIHIECTFESKSDTYTFWGGKTSDEMCFAYMEIYPRPNAKPFQAIYNIDDMNSCLWTDDPLGPTKLFDCQDTRAFRKRILGALNTTSRGDFLKYCNPSEYPARHCTRECYRYLKKSNFLADPCMQGAVFRFFAGFWVSRKYENAFRVQSQVNLCLWLRDEPGQCNFAMTTGQSPFLNVLTFSLIGFGMIDRFY